MGTPAFSVPVLAALLDAGHDVACAYSQPPRPAGRGRKPRRSPMQAFAETRGLAVRTPETLDGADEAAAFAALAPDAGVVAAYGLMLPKEILDVPRLGCLNVHASLLPRWRGAAPIQRAILAGDSETGVTIMGIDEKLDSGPIVLAERVPITPATTAAELHDRLAALGARLMVAALEGLATGRLAGRPQPTDGATYAPKVKAFEGRLDWRHPAAELERRVRALGPRPGAWFEHGGWRIKVLTAQMADRGTGVPPGTLLDRRFTVACGAGALRLSRVQRAGKAPIDGAAFLRGYPLAVGTRL